jgi:hypothetical protein
MGHLSMRELYEGILEGGLLYWGPRKICEVRLWKLASVSVGAPLLGNMEGSSYPKAFEIRERFI